VKRGNDMKEETKFKSRTSWREKLETHKEPQIHRLLIPGSLDVENLICKVPDGRLITDKQIKDRLTKDYKVHATCVKVLGIHIRIIAEAAEEESREGKTEITPYWRVIGKDGSLKPKFPGGVEAQAGRLKRERHIIIQGKDKKPPRVKDFEKYLVKL
jgi:hypothetical protein